jgi:hypothetical protein
MQWRPVVEAVGGARVEVRVVGGRGRWVGSEGTEQRSARKKTCSGGVQ